jgi:hypothetical protein
MNPFSDTLAFLMRGEWPIYLFWLLLIGSIAVAWVNLASDPEQRTVTHVWMGLARLLIGGLWWQQTLWKLPPTYTDHADGVTGGLHQWVAEMVDNAAFSWQSAFVKEIVQAHFYLFAPQVYAIEVCIAISLMLGLFARAGGALGALMAINLWLGLYRASYEWPWTYFFLILLQTTFVMLHAGRSLGVDAILARRETAASQPQGAAARVLASLR